jgi:hypothetical protein
MNWPTRGSRSLGGPAQSEAAGFASPSAGHIPAPYRRVLAALLVILCVWFALRWGSDYFDRPPEIAKKQSTIIDPPPEDVGFVRANPTVPVPVSPFRFTEIAESAGIDFVHVSGMTEAKHFPTAYGSGVAIFDADNDGKLDLYFASATYFPIGSVKTGPNRFYRNRGNNRFEDRTLQSGLGFEGYCQGIVVGDIDNDGAPDVFLCNYGLNQLYRNRGDGTFENITESAGFRQAGWSTTGAFLDFDRDGDLDLYVANYGSWNLADDKERCEAAVSPLVPGARRVRIYCSPKSILPARHDLFRNNGDGTFTEVAAAAGLTRADGRGLGVIATDLNDDGLTDLYVANDMCPNFVYFNRGDGTFEDVTDSSGAGYGSEGQVLAGMGVDAEDINADGRADVFVTNYWNEPNSLYLNLGQGRFAERSRSSGFMHDSLPWVGWGCALADFDNDGVPDVFVTNGQVDDNLEEAGHVNPYLEPALLHHNDGHGKFTLATRMAGAYFETDHVGRGLAVGDLDNDGDIDLVINHKGGPPALLRNDTSTNHNWIRIRLEGTRSNREGIGARVSVETEDQTIVRIRKGGASYGSAHDPRLLFGLRNARAARRVTIRWPSGRTEAFENLAGSRDWLLREGSGRGISPAEPGGDAADRGHRRSSE